MRIKDIPAENRPRERLKMEGVSVLSDAELMALILQSGSYGENVIDLSNRLIAAYGLTELNSLSLNELMNLKGIGIAKATKLLAAFELSRRANSGKICEQVIHDASDIAKYYMEKLKDKKKEYFIAVFLDSKNKIIKDEVISIGTLNASLVHPREVFKEAIKNSANSIVLVHNHPSGDCEPSGEDEILTQRLIDVGNIAQIKVIDHIIITPDKYYSIVQNLND